MKKIKDEKVKDEKKKKMEFTNHYTFAEKQAIAEKIGVATREEIANEMQQLFFFAQSEDANVSPYSKLGNKIVDHFTLVHRLETKGKYNANFYDFLENIDTFKEKKFIQTMIQYYKDVKNKHGKKDPVKVYKEIYNICISAINIMKPINCIEIFKTVLREKEKEKEKIKLLNFCLGWGGTMVAVAALHFDSHIGIDMNVSLEPAYNQLVTFLQEEDVKTHFTTICQDALTVDYSALEYNVVFTSPPYYFLEVYENNHVYLSKQEMNTLFYEPLFAKTYEGLQPGGIYMINICKEVYDNVLEPLLGPTMETISLKKSKRQNNHTELVYIWHKKE